VAASPGAAVDVRVRNNVVVRGEGRPMVFGHGFGCSQAMWRYVAPDFERDHQVVLFDYVGAGGSDLTSYRPGRYDSLEGYATDLLEIIEQLDLHDVVFVGHSVSTMVGVLAANRDPSRFGALVLVSPSPRYIDDGDYVGGFEREDIDALLDSLDANHIGWSEAMAPVIMGNPDRPELADELADSFCRYDPAIERQFARVTFLSDHRRDLADVTVPTLVLQCQDDAIAPEAVGRYVHERIAGSEFVMIPVTGHVPNLSGPTEVIRAIRDHLR
jgi:sigma-B regulation protein RsbQ